MIILLLQSFYIMLPAYFANMAPVIAKRLKILPGMNKPIDMDIKMEDGKPIFGKHKTYRGVAVGILMGIVVAFVQWLLSPLIGSVSILDYSSYVLIGFLMGSGAIIGDMVKSFAKRRCGIMPGHKFIPFDQIDFILGAYLFTLPFYGDFITMELLASSIIITFFLHIIVNHAAFYLGIRNEKW
ncbi:CDP-2,3-bis-(O-geranylgeranyl)-sn-glycerol synthase [Candidatus Woesearchaeota archaeon]|nr:CDP-2,3-bis-(O-geranylgeranyl)-sn-glycerol synthase [Candidatus Woesearchaeota archaeon]